MSTPTAILLLSILVAGATFFVAEVILARRLTAKMQLKWIDSQLFAATVARVLLSHKQVTHYRNTICRQIQLNTYSVPDNIAIAGIIAKYDSQTAHPAARHRDHVQERIDTLSQLASVLTTSSELPSEQQLRHIQQLTTAASQSHPAFKGGMLTDGTWMKAQPQRTDYDDSRISTLLDQVCTLSKTIQHARAQAREDELLQQGYCRHSSGRWWGDASDVLRVQLNEEWNRLRDSYEPTIRHSEGLWIIISFSVILATPLFIMCFGIK